MQASTENKQKYIPDGLRKEKLGDYKSSGNSGHTVYEQRT